MGKYPPERLRGLTPMKALGAGESSHTHRVRAPEEVNEWFAAMSPEERGLMLLQAYRGTAPGRAALDLEHEKIRREWRTGKYDSQRDLCRALGVSKSAVSRVLKTA
ncbi:hypothetical protein SAMN04488058_1493 [Deinococcus reticulitermitis]|uniref:Uncharacterized protein n=1 Tax=Deinococcus reticulitermitis TaxID=856736 RepID=A0A1H7CY57_9DEIO|nr:hypothetical protein [Deinococcus reticulitermitis]SEJ94653.1 hypothetical protein SAMN04488058_1493 [Deinococcus reticulitermitis]